METRPTIAIFEFLETREPLLSVPFLESNWLLMEFVKTANLHSAYVRFLCRAPPTHSKAGTIICLK